MNADTWKGIGLVVFCALVLYACVSDSMKSKPVKPLEGTDECYAAQAKVARDYDGDSMVGAIHEMSEACRR